jgi:hypothetical protein
MVTHEKILKASGPISVEIIQIMPVAPKSLPDQKSGLFYRLFWHLGLANRLREPLF